MDIVFHFVLVSTEGNDCYFKLADAGLAYAARCNDIEILGKLNFVAAMTCYVNHVAEHSHVQEQLLADSTPLLKCFGSYLTKVFNDLSFDITYY